MALNYSDDLFMLQVRLFRLAQSRWDKTTDECENNKLRGKLCRLVSMNTQCSF